MKKFSIMKDMNIEKMEQIYYTRDYDKFKMLGDNRVVVISNAIRESISTKGILEPITVDESLNVIDGQHRFHVAKSLNIPIPFKMVVGLTLLDVLDTKATTRNWTAKNYIDYYAVNMNKHYITLKDMIVKEELSTRTLVALYHFGRHDIGSSEEKAIVNTGKLNMYKQKEYGNTIISNYRELIQLMGSNKTQAIKRALFKIMDSDNYNHNRMLSQLEKCGATVLFNTKSLKYSQCISKLEEVFNYRQRNKMKLSDEM
ncbi:MAG: ParB N-terminal domain-containing protein [Fusobacteriaceae bacterium]